MIPDLREFDFSCVVVHVERDLDALFDRGSVVSKRRSVGFATVRGTWVRLEVRNKFRDDGWYGVEESGALVGVARPAWFQGWAWEDDELGVVWRVDETEYVADRPVKPGGILTTEPDLSDAWWATFNGSLSALSAHSTARTAVHQARIAETINRVFPQAAGVDITVDEWVAAHADLAWANLTAPACWFLDWEGWGLAPRGYDAACLWRESLAVPELAERVYVTRRADLETRSGVISRLYVCAVIIAAGAGYAGPLWEPVRAAAEKLLIDLRA